MLDKRKLRIRGQKRKVPDVQVTMDVGSGDYSAMWIRQKRAISSLSADNVLDHANVPDNEIIDHRTIAAEARNILRAGGSVPPNEIPSQPTMIHGMRIVVDPLVPRGQVMFRSHDEAYIMNTETYNKILVRMGGS